MMAKDIADIRLSKYFGGYMILVHLLSVTIAYIALSIVSTMEDPLFFCIQAYLMGLSLYIISDAIVTSIWSMFKGRKS